MLKQAYMKGKYYYHLLQYHHNQLLQNEGISEELKIKRKIKAIYHNSMVIEISSRI